MPWTFNPPLGEYDTFAEYLSLVERTSSTLYAVPDSAADFKTLCESVELYDTAARSCERGDYMDPLLVFRWLVVAMLFLTASSFLGRMVLLVFVGACFSLVDAATGTISACTRGGFVARVVCRRSGVSARDGY